MTYKVFLLTTYTAYRMALFLQLCILMLKMIVLYNDAHHIVSLTHTVGYKSSFALLPHRMINYCFTNPILDVRLNSLTRKQYTYTTTKNTNLLTAGSGTVTDKITVTITSSFLNHHHRFLNQTCRKLRALANSNKCRLMNQVN